MYTLKAQENLPPTMAASMVLGESTPPVSASAGATSDTENVKGTNMDECVICLERKPEVSLPCCHAYCLPCIEQWWEYSEYAFEEECIARNLVGQM